MLAILFTNAAFASYLTYLIIERKSDCFKSKKILVGTAWFIGSGLCSLLLFIPSGRWEYDSLAFDLMDP